MRNRIVKIIVFVALLLITLLLLFSPALFSGDSQEYLETSENENREQLALQPSGEKPPESLDSSSAQAGTVDEERPDIKAKKEFAVRWNAYSDEEERYTKTTEQLIVKYFTPNDLGYVNEILDSDSCAGDWITMLEVICRLEPDKTKAFNTATEFLYKKKDWYSIAKHYNNNISGEVYNAFAAISRVGYIKSDEAKQFLVAHLDRDKARELVRSADLPVRSRAFTTEEAAAIVQESAAYGLLFMEDDEAIEFVRDAFAARPYISMKEDFIEQRLSRGFQRVLGLHNFYKDKGREEGGRTLLEHNRMNMGSDLGMPLPIVEYKPPLPAPEK